MKIKEGGGMDLQKEREAFEKWFATRYPNIQKTIDLHNDHESIVFRNNQAEAWQAAKAQAVPEGFVLVPKEPTEAMIQRGTKANSECLNENAPLGERLFRHPALQVYQAMVNGSGE